MRFTRFERELLTLMTLEILSSNFDNDEYGSKASHTANDISKMIATTPQHALRTLRELQNEGKVYAYKVTRKKGFTVNRFTISDSGREYLTMFDFMIPKTRDKFLTYKRGLVCLTTPL